MSNDAELLEIDRQIKDSKAQMELATALQRLSNNRDFKKVILEEYFREEAIRLVSLKGDPGMQKPENQSSIIKQMDAIGSLAEYFRTIEFLGNQAQKQLAEAQQVREEILAEED